MLAQAGPDFLARVGMEFFCAVPTNVPLAPSLDANRRYFVSARLGCFTYQPVIAAPNLAAICLE